MSVDNSQNNPIHKRETRLDEGRKNDQRLAEWIFDPRSTARAHIRRAGETPLTAPPVIGSPVDSVLEVLRDPHPVIEGQGGNPNVITSPAVMVKPLVSAVAALTKGRPH